MNLGLAASMASFLLCAGSRGRRFALPHSRIMIHQPMGGAQGQAEDIRVEASQIMRIRNNLVKMYSLMTGQTTEQIVLDLDRWVHRVPLTHFYYYAEQYYGEKSFSFSAFKNCSLEPLKHHQIFLHFVARTSPIPTLTVPIS